METKIGLLQIAWNEEATRLLAGATGSDPTYSLNELRQEVEGGQVRLYRVVEGRGEEAFLLGYVCLWVDRFGGGNELVIQAGAAMTKEADVLRKAMPAFEQVARDSNCIAIRAHVEGKGREKVLQRVGFHTAEIVMRKGV